MRSLSRRGFLGLLATATVGACVAAKVPTGWLPEPIQRLAACEYLRKHYNAWANGRREMPGGLLAGRELFEAFEGEIAANMRFTTLDMADRGIPSLLFKGCSLVADGRGWNVRVLSQAEWAKYLEARVA